MNSKKILSENLSRLIKQSGKTRPQVGADLGVPYSTIVNWTTEQAYPSLKNMNKLTDYFNVSTSQLIEPHDKMPDGAIKENGPYRRLPVIGQIACGNPTDAIKTTGTYKITDAIGLPSGINYWLKCKGDSMFPTITNGSYVLIHQQAEVGENHVAAVQMQDQYDDRPDVTLKRVVKQEKNIIVLKPDNSHYDPIILDKENPGRIIGRAIKVEHDL